MSVTQEVTRYYPQYDILPATVDHLDHHPADYPPVVLLDARHRQATFRLKFGNFLIGFIFLTATVGAFVVWFMQPTLVETGKKYVSTIFKDPCTEAREHYDRAAIYKTRVAFQEHINRFGGCDYAGLAQIGIDKLSKSQAGSTTEHSSKPKIQTKRSVQLARKKAAPDQPVPSLSNIRRRADNLASAY
jgi:hypothetical protein